MNSITHTAPPPKRQNWRVGMVISLLVMLALLGLILAVAPRKDGVIDWVGQMIDHGWMAWTLPIALFFWVIASMLTVMTLLAIRFPETERIGILRIATTRGDRLFITLLGSAFICLAWLFFAGPPLWWAVLICLVYGILVFLFV